MYLHRTQCHLQSAKAGRGNCMVIVLIKNGLYWHDLCFDFCHIYLGKMFNILISSFRSNIAFYNQFDKNDQYVVNITGHRSWSKWKMRILLWSIWIWHLLNQSAHAQKTSMKLSPDSTFSSTMLVKLILL